MIKGWDTKISYRQRGENMKTKVTMGCLYTT